MSSVAEAVAAVAAAAVEGVLPAVEELVTGHSWTGPEPGLELEPEQQHEQQRPPSWVYRVVDQSWKA